MDVVFRDVLAMKVASGYDGLTVAVAVEVGEVDGFFRVARGELLEVGRF
ncbi:hypothetical protein OG474_24710 [Kribbella sp. NBC_01505]